MTSTRYICTALLALTHALWLPPTAHAQRPHGDTRHKQPRHAQPAKERLGPHTGQMAIGSYFQQQHVDAARLYYGMPENMGFCPPGLAKKGTGCLPPGQVKAWRKGLPLPSTVVYYDLPRSAVLSLGVPPAGYKYVRVASDILLIAIGTRLVVDAMEDLVR